VVKPGNAGGAKGAGRPDVSGGQPLGRDEPASASKPKEKPFVISKWVVVDAYEKVKANAGAAGVDGESIAAFEANRKANLYKLWNRLSSGTYFPPPVRAVEIPKKAGGSDRGQDVSGA
jgi:RNA-directed DNA polymerase